MERLDSAIDQHSRHAGHTALHADWSAENQHVHKAVSRDVHSSAEVQHMLQPVAIGGSKSESAGDRRAASLSGDEATTRKAYDALLKDSSNYRTDLGLKDSIKDKDILAVTVRHSAVDQNNFVEKSIPELAKKGVKIFGSEFLPTRMQPTVDDYAKLLNDPRSTPKAIESKRNEIKEAYNADTANKDLGDAQRDLVKMVDAAIHSGMTVVCMEPPIDKPFHKDSGYELMHSAMRSLKPEDEKAFRAFVDKNNPAGQKAAKEQLRSSLSSSKPADAARISRALDALGQARDAGMDFSKETIPPPAAKDDANWRVEKIRLRNLSMANTLGKAMKANPGARAMTVTGYEHFGSSNLNDTSPENLATEASYPVPTVNETLARQYHFSTSSVLLAGKPSTEKPLNGADRGVEISGIRKAIEDNHLSSKALTLQPGTQFDYIMNVPD